MKKILLLLFVFHYILGFSQGTTTLVAFEDNGESREIPISPEQGAFVGISGFILTEEWQGELYIRYKSAAGWSDWQLFKKGAHEPTPGRTVFEAPPILSTEIHAISIKASPLLKKFHLRIFKPFDGEVTGENTMKQSACTCPYPQICERDCWCPNGECPRRGTPFHHDVSHIIIHHSAGFNNHPDYKQVMQYYWDLHVNTNGWDDLAYNFLIDPNGVVYEGRGQDVRGSHFSCMNTGTSGICMIGDFQGRYPTQEALLKLLEVLSAEVCYYDLNAEAVEFHTSSRLNLPVIASHRDGNPSPAPTSCATGTICPGDSLYSLLPYLRSAVSENACVTSVSHHSSSFPEPFPNPVDRTLILSNRVHHAQIIAASGKKWNFPVQNGQIDVSNLSPGIYLIMTNEGSFRFVKN